MTDALPPKEAGVPAAPVPAARPAAPAADEVGYPSSTWERVLLLPGLELCVRSDAGALVKRLAEEIIGGTE